MSEKAYFLSGVELAVFALAQGMDQFYCFELLEKETFQKKDMIQVLHTMVKHSWGTIENKKIQLNGDMGALIGQIADSKKLCSVYVGDGRQYIGYFGEMITMVSSEEQNVFRLCNVGWENILQWLEDEGILPHPYWEQDKDFTQEIENNGIVFQEMKNLKSGKIKQDSPICRIEIREKQTGRICEQWIFTEGLLNMWMIHMCENLTIDRVCPDSMEVRQNLLTEWRKTK